MRSQPRPGAKARWPARRRGAFHRRMVVRLFPSRMASQKIFLKRSWPMVHEGKAGSPGSRRFGKSRRRGCRGKVIPVNVGEDITAPAAVASEGRIPVRSERAALVARWFGLGRRRDDEGGHDTAGLRNGKPDAAMVPPAAGTILLIAGPSGAGKSTLLRALRERAIGDGRDWIDLAAMAPLAELPLVDCFDNLLDVGASPAPLRDVLLLLARVGLGEAWTYLRTAAELSEGQKWRLKLALALHAAANVATSAAANGAAPMPILACDEFAAVL